MVSINQYVKIQLLPEPPQDFITELPPLQKAMVLDVSPDIDMPFVKDNLVQIVRGRSVLLHNNYFIHKDYILTYANSNNHRDN